MAYSKPNPGAGDDYYSGGESAQPQEPGGQEEGGKDSGQTTIVPASLCPGMKVGDEMVVKIVGIHDDQYEIAYAPEKGGKEESEGGEEPAPAENPMSSMME